MPRNPRADQIGTGGRIKSESPGGCARNAHTRLRCSIRLLAGGNFAQGYLPSACIKEQVEAVGPRRVCKKRSANATAKVFDKDIECNAAEFLREAPRASD